MKLLNIDMELLAGSREIIANTLHRLKKKRKMQLKITPPRCVGPAQARDRRAPGRRAAAQQSAREFDQTSARRSPSDQIVPPNQVSDRRKPSRQHALGRWIGAEHDQGTLTIL